MRRYMWPNGVLPSATALINAAHSASQGRFTLEGVENHAAREPSFGYEEHRTLLNGLYSQTILARCVNGGVDWRRI